MSRSNRSINSLLLVVIYQNSWKYSVGYLETWQIFPHWFGPPHQSTCKSIAHRFYVHCAILRSRADSALLSQTKQAITVSLFTGAIFIAKPQLVKKHTDKPSGTFNPFTAVFTSHDVPGEPFRHLPQTWTSLCVSVCICLPLSVSLCIYMCVCVCVFRGREREREGRGGGGGGVRRELKLENLILQRL